MERLIDLIGKTRRRYKRLEEIFGRIRKRNLELFLTTPRRTEPILGEVLCPETGENGYLVIERSTEDGMTVRCMQCGHKITREIGYFAGYF